MNRIEQQAQCLFLFSPMTILSNNDKKPVKTSYGVQPKRSHNCLQTIVNV